MIRENKFDGIDNLYTNKDIKRYFWYHGLIENLMIMRKYLNITMSISYMMQRKKMRNIIEEF